MTDPLAVDRSKLRPGDQYQQKKDNPDDNLHLLVDVAHEDFIPEDAVILQTPPISPQAGPSKAPDLVDANLEEGLTQGTSTDAAQSFSCTNCDNDMLVSESGHHCHRVCQQCILGLAKSLADQGFKSVFCPCGDELSLEALEPLLPVQTAL